MVNAYKQRTYDENEIGYLEEHLGGKYSFSKLRKGLRVFVISSKWT
jgi:hypothetical protein